ncbi:Peptidase C1 domain containing protein [Asbolus verrucosus]|uniref:Peptidase C1 domain containing protein n=1 Tax=Asbolus verrucosus TaxID=1661398 RepID=A0A482VMJ5_ASBVE|nr:Peptidase C1 domain containing protein [Asbolus verrucosus]
MDCSTNYGNHGCGKGRIDFAFNYIHDYGVESENNYPYEGRDDTCRFNKSLSVTKVSAYNWITSGDELALQKAVDQVGPIAAAIQATFPFLEYEGGYLYDKYCSSKKGDANHAVLVVGYGSNGTHDYWIVKNSFGTTWGDSGYAYMARNADNNCGIATQALYPVL